MREENTPDYPTKNLPAQGEADTGNKPISTIEKSGTHHKIYKQFAAYFKV